MLCCFAVKDNKHRCWYYIKDIMSCDQIALKLCACHDFLIYARMENSWVK